MSEIEVLKYAAEMRIQGLRPATINFRMRTLDVIRKRMGSPLLKADEPTVARWQEATQCLSLNTRHVYSRELRHFYAWCRQRGLTDVARDEWVILARTTPGLPRPCPMSDISEALAAASPRTAIWIELAAGAGLRAGEIARLRAENVRPETGSIEVRDGKGGRDRVVLVGNRLLQALQPWLPARGRLWNVQPRRVTVEVSELFHSLGMPWTAHSLRHTAATGWLAASGNILAVKEQLGHASLATTQIYARLQPTVARAAADGLDGSLPFAA